MESRDTPSNSARQERLDMGLADGPEPNLEETKFADIRLPMTDTPADLDKKISLAWVLSLEGVS